MPSKTTQQYPWIILLGAILLFLAASFKPEPSTSLPAPGRGQTIRLARADWDTSWFEAEIFRQLLQRLGYAVTEPKTMNDTAFWDAVSRNEIDFWPSGWFPNSDKKLAQVQHKVGVVGYVVKAGALQGYLVDKKTSQQHGITNLQKLKQPEIAKLFDTDGDGKADLTGCNPDWTCREVIEHQLKAYGLGATVKQVQGDYNSLMARAIARYKEGKPILFYTWTPNWTVGKLVPGKDVVWLEVPFPSLPTEQKDKETLTKVSRVNGCIDDPCEMGWPPNDIRVVANKDFLEKNPQAKRLFERIEIPLQDISSQNARMFERESSQEDIRRHAREWIEAHQNEVDSWLREAVGAAGQ
jgi:glycine betaine/proline transport system substrate-binding protein